MGLGEEEAKAKFGFLLEALQMGAPPHGGFAMGIERFVMLMAGEPDIRQVIAFPKVASGSDPLTGAPTPYPDQALRELGIRSIVDLRIKRRCLPADGEVILRDARAARPRVNRRISRRWPVKDRVGRERRR